MESQQAGEQSHEDMDDQPTTDTSKPRVTSDQPALDEKALGDKYMTDTEDERG